MGKKRLLILGSVEDFTQLTKQAVACGVYTVVADAAENGEAKKFAHKAYTIDINDSQEIKKICQYEKIDQILSSFSDNLFEKMVDYSYENSLPTYCPFEKVRYLRDKLLMKEMFKILNIPCAQAQLLSTKDVQRERVYLEYPFVLKPIDSWGSRGMSIINSFEELEKSIDEHSLRHTEKVMLEKINEGYEINVQSWIKNGNAHFVNFGDRETTAQTRGELPHLTRQKYPSVYYDELHETVRKYLVQIAEFVNMEEGPMSIQLFYSEGKISVGEVAGRFFGMEQGLSIISNNIDRNELLLNMILNPEANSKILERFSSDNGRFAFGLFIKGKEGIVRDLGNSHKFLNYDFVDAFTLYAKPNMTTKNMPWLLKILGHCESQEQADLYAKQVYESLYIPGLDGENLVTYNTLINYERKEEC